MKKFKVGDILIGNKSNTYGASNQYDKCKVIELRPAAYTEDIRVEMIEGSDIEQKMDVESKYFDLVSKLPKRPKYPTHIVVWTTRGCGDPCEICYSNDEAKLKASEILRRTDTVKDLVRIYEIKKIFKPSLSLRVNVVKS